MDFSFIIPGTIRNGAVIREMRNKTIDNIAQIKEQLIQIGYNPAEVDYMIRTCSNGLNINKIDNKQLQKIEATLTEQLAVARQCIDILRIPQ